MLSVNLCTSREHEDTDLYEEVEYLDEEYLAQQIADDEAVDTHILPNVSLFLL